MASGDQVLFCPFCKESYEGETECPEHELELVPFDKLPREKVERGPVADDELLPVWSPRFGRGPVALGCAITAAAFAALPFAEAQLGDTTVVATALDMARDRAINLWTITLVVLGQVALLVARRTKAELRGARLTWPLLSLVGVASVFYTLERVAAQTSALQRVGRDAAAVAQWGAWVIVGGLVLTALAGLRVGRD